MIEPRLRLSAKSETGAAAWPGPARRVGLAMRRRLDERPTTDVIFDAFGFGGAGVPAGTVVKVQGIGGLEPVAPTFTTDHSGPAPSSC